MKQFICTGFALLFLTACQSSKTESPTPKVAPKETPAENPKATPKETSKATSNEAQKDVPQGPEASSQTPPVQITPSGVTAERVQVSSPQMESGQNFENQTALNESSRLAPAPNAQSPAQSVTNPLEFLPENFSNYFSASGPTTHSQVAPQIVPQATPQAAPDTSVETPQVSALEARCKPMIERRAEMFRNLFGIPQAKNHINHLHSSLMEGFRKEMKADDAEYLDLTLRLNALEIQDQEARKAAGIPVSIPNSSDELTAAEQANLNSAGIIQNAFNEAAKSLFPNMTTLLNGERSLSQREWIYRTQINQFDSWFTIERRNARGFNRYEQYYFQTDILGLHRMSYKVSYRFETKPSEAPSEFDEILWPWTKKEFLKVYLERRIPDDKGTELQSSPEFRMTFAYPSDEDPNRSGRERVFPLVSAIHYTFKTNEERQCDKIVFAMPYEKSTY